MLAVIQLISQHPEEFERLLLGEEGDFDEEDDGEEEGAEGQIVVSQQEEEAINRVRFI